jgi:hypothetical protein
MTLPAAFNDNISHTGASWGLTQIGARRRNRMLLTLAAICGGIVAALAGAVALVWTSEPTGAAANGESATTGEQAGDPGASAASPSTPTDPTPEAPSSTSEGATGETSSAADASASSSASSSAPPRTTRPSGTRATSHQKPGDKPRDFGSRR